MLLCAIRVRKNVYCFLQLVSERQREIEELEEAEDPPEVPLSPILHDKKSGENLHIFGDMFDMNFPYGLIFDEVQLQTGLLAGHKNTT